MVDFPFSALCMLPGIIFPALPVMVASCGLHAGAVLAVRAGTLFPDFLFGRVLRFPG
jgi:hypothetical protein